MSRITSMAGGFAGLNALGDSGSTVVVPGAPTITSAFVSVTSGVATSGTIDFTAPASDGGSTIISYTAVSSPGGLTSTVNQSGSGSITVTGLTMGTSYTFTVYATNSAGNGPSSSASSPTGDQYFVSGTNTFTIPAGVTSISVLLTGGGGGGGISAFIGSPWAGGGGGGGTAYRNDIVVTPGATLTCIVGGGGASGASYSPYNNTRTTCRFGSNGGDSSITGSGFSTITAGGGRAAVANNTFGAGGTISGTYTGGGSGGPGGSNAGGGGGGSGGFSGNGGRGGAVGSVAQAGTGGAGGGAGYGREKYGSSSAVLTGGTGGTGPGTTNGIAGTASAGTVAGDGGDSASAWTSAGVTNVGGGGGSTYTVSSVSQTTAYSNFGQSGRIRIIWPGNLRLYPSSNIY